MPWGKAAEWLLTGRTTQVSLVEVKALLRHLEADYRVNMVHADVLARMGETVMGYSSRDLGKIYLNQEIFATRPLWLSMQKIHEASHLMGASEYAAYRLEGEMFRAMSWANKRAFFREILFDPREIVRFYGNGYFPNIYSLYQSIGYFPAGNPTSFFGPFSPFGLP